jgi:hypothetical protein
MGAMNDQGDKTPSENEAGERAPILRIEPRRIERRIPGVGLVRFRAPAAAAEEKLEPLYAEDINARTYVNALVAACVEAPEVSAEDVDAWSDRGRAIARVAAAETLDCVSAYRRLAGSGRDGDERLREAMRKRNEELAKRLRMTVSALSASTNVARPFDPTRLGATGVVERMLQQQRQMERLVFSSPAFDAVSKLSHSPLFDIGRSPLYAQLEQLKKLSAFTVPRAPFATFPKMPAFDIGRSPLFGELEQLKKLTSIAMPRGVVGLSDVAAGRLAGLASPSYFGALQGIARIPDYAKLFAGLPDTAKLFGGIGRIDTAKLFGGIGPFPDYGKLFGGISAQLHARAFASQYDSISRVLERMREQVTGPLRAYVAWVEREWAQAKAEHRPPPVLFVIASLPALLGLQLLEELRADDEPLLASLERELASGTLAPELQTAFQRNALLDPVAKRHLAQGVDWVAAGRYVDAAPPLYQGLERAFRLTARGRGVVDANGNFLLPGVRKTRMRKIEDTFRYLGLDHLYLRFLHAWVFGEIGNLARHGDLPEVEHRQWVLRATVALVGWLEYVGGEANAVSELVERLELESGDSADVG